MPHRLLRVCAIVALAGCASTPPPAPAEEPKPVASSKAWYEDVSVVAPVERTRRAGERSMPPSRRPREYLVTEDRYGQLMKRYALGFSPDDCTSFCKQDRARTPSEDGEWVWVLRCLLKRNVRDEPVVACREDPVEPGRVPAPTSRAVAGTAE